MSKSNKKIIKLVQPTPLVVSATIDEASILKDLVEKLAHRRNDTGYNQGSMLAGNKLIETSSLEAFVSGSLNVSGEGDGIKLSFVTCFLFTCTKAPGEDYTLSWSSSLS